MVQSSIQVWEDFFKRYYWEDILELAKDFPEKRSLVVQFPDIERFDMELAPELLEHPDHVIKQSKEDIEEIRTLGEDPKIYKKATGSIAPSIYGYDQVKEAMALPLLSGIAKY